MDNLTVMGCIALVLTINLRSLYLFVAWLCIAPIYLANAGDVDVNAKALDNEKHLSDMGITPTKARFRLTFDDVQLPASEKMGFLGMTLLYDMNDWLSVGAASYGALSGQRGGFITIGMASELRHALSEQVELNAGVFVGAGGGRGGVLLSGGGLMLRYHAGAEFVSPWGNIGAGYSFVDFPNGTIHSAQPYMSYAYKFTAPMASAWLDAPEKEHASYSPLAEQEFAMVQRTYMIPAGVLQDNAKAVQHSRLNLLGVEWNRYIDENLFFRVETEGAMGGQSSGYMQIFLGAGYRFVWRDDVWLKLTGSVGVAGGGAVATGGGLLLETSASLQYRLAENLYAEAGLGYVTSPGESFKATSYQAKMGYHFFSPDYDRKFSIADVSAFDFNHLRVRAAHQTYVKASDQWRSRDQDLNVDLLGIQADYFLNDYFFLSGQVLAAYKGRAGAYMIGLVGVGIHVPLLSVFFMQAELLGGAAGGGSLAVGSGLVWQSQVGLGVKLADEYSLLASYGYLSAIQKGADIAGLKATVLNLSLNYNFTLFTK